ncbi:hypothetical protein BDQ94DRAFT_138571 [Aspergillus welwitschiae]|uniref:Uncharacterized protein n=1 Tax=Aspergillus welwitschiae TaxID=1341132 RepID=A0A3F3QA70_9EURO|nr:hypothetical protein BDQ94DRAFT_138571 [Aspergillus welwitschiae]RDH36104.1 hypothetical protein BDQ94DRAFT_138571 [Aspergillus welwitschiae]
MIHALFMATFSSLQGWPPALYHARNNYGLALSLTRKARSGHQKRFCWIELYSRCCS